VTLPLYVLVALSGLAVGSFQNVVVHRVPLALSVVTPGSRCPQCEHPIRARHNIPVLGWLVLRGKCADCDMAISARYPAVEFFTAALFVAIAARLDQLHLLSALPAYLYLAAIAVALALIDLDVRRLPNAIVLPSYPVLAVLLAFSAAYEHDWWAFIRAASGAAALFAAYFLIVWAYPAGMGSGDIKLAGLLGGALAFLSWSDLVVGAFAGFLLGSIFGVALLAMRRATGKSSVPFGPFMIGGALLALFAGDPLATLYLHALAH